MVQFSLPSREDTRFPLLTHHHLILVAFLALTTPVFVQAVVGANPSVATTEEAMELLRRPGDSHHRNYHGIIRTAKTDLWRQELTSDDGATISVQSNDQKNQMNGDLYPPKDTIPDVSHPQVKQWVSEIDWSKVPQIPVAGGLPDSPHFPNCPPDDEVDKRSCWWSCDGCVQPSDVVTCPNQSDWGLTYDDGPSVASREMMKYLNSNKISATFFIVGSRVLEYPDILREQVAQGHHIAMHTWSHAGLTTLTNEQIVAEVRWSEKIIRDATGLTVKYIRPPYGDVDNRVREILRQMGYVTVIWTLGWDTNDWRVAMNQIQPDEIMQTFENALDNRELIRSSTGGPGGPVTLEHDLTDGTIYLSKQIIPMGMNRGLRPMSLDRCLNDASPYQKGSLTDQKANGGAGNHTSLATKPGITTPGNGAADYNGSTAQDTKNEQGLSMSKSEAKAMIHNGAQTMGYTVMGLAMVASLMMAL